MVSTNGEEFDLSSGFRGDSWNEDNSQELPPIKQVEPKSERAINKPKPIEKELTITVSQPIYLSETNSIEIKSRFFLILLGIFAPPLAYIYIGSMRRILHYGLCYIILFIPFINLAAMIAILILSIIDLITFIFKDSTVLEEQFNIKFQEPNGWTYSTVKGLLLALLPLILVVVTCLLAIIPVIFATKI